MKEQNFGGNLGNWKLTDVHCKILKAVPPVGEGSPLSALTPYQLIPFGNT